MTTLDSKCVTFPRALTVPVPYFLICFNRGNMLIKATLMLVIFELVPQKFVTHLNYLGCSAISYFLNEGYVYLLKLKLPSSVYFTDCIFYSSYL